MNSLPTVSIVIPTYNREQILIQTLDNLLALEHKAIEIIVVDQSLEHQEDVNESLSKLDASEKIHWLKLSQPSIPNAMNIGAISAKGDIILFVDDDIICRSELVLEHAKRYQDTSVHGVAGQVIQSWEQELAPEEGSYRSGHHHDPDAFMFNSAIGCTVRRFIGCNVSFRRIELLKIGGFDNNFAKVAYRYESESAERFVSSGYTLVFEPSASIHHLKEESGGTRSYGDHLTTIKPAHSVGMYYYFLVVKNQHKRWFRFIGSPFKHCATRFHLRHPWYIPITFISQLSGMIWAVYLRLQGQKLIQPWQLKQYSKT